MNRASPLGTWHTREDRHHARMTLNRWLLVALAVALVVLALVGWNAWEMAHRTLEAKP